MSDRIAPAGLTGAPLGDALRALPLASPSTSAWPQLEAALRAARIATPPRRSPWRYALPAALAAGLALFLLLPRVATTPNVPANTAEVVSIPGVASPATDGVEDIESLRRHSQRLETWLQRLAAGNAPLDGQDLMAAAEVEDLIGLIDVQLGGAGAQPEAAELWRQRIALLQDLGAIRTAAYDPANAGVADALLIPQGRATAPALVH